METRGGIASAENLADSTMMLAQAGSEAAVLAALAAHAAPAALESYSRESIKLSQFATKLGDKKKKAVKASAKKGAGGAKTVPDQGARSRDDDTVPPPAR